MKICYLAHANSVHTMKWIKYFIGKRHDVHLISFNKPLESIPSLKYHELKRILFSRMDYIMNVPILRALLKEISPDIFHVHYATDYGMMGALAGFHPYILSVWGSDIYITPKRSFFHRMLVRFNLRKADRICSTSRAMADETVKYCGKNIDITPFGVDTGIFKPRKREKKDAVVIGTIKALVDGKGYGTDTLIQIFSKIIRTYGNAELRIAGDGPHRKYLEQLSCELGVSNKVKFYGRIAHADVPEYLSDIDIYCCLSRSANESFGVANLEASSCEIPVIASRVGGLPEVVRHGETGYLVDPNDHDRTYSLLLSLLNDARLRREMGKAGRDFIRRNYEWQDNAKIMERIYESVAKHE